MALFSLIKNKIWAIGAAVFAVLIALLQIQTKRAKSWKNKARSAERQLQFDEDKATLDTELDQEHSHRVEESRRDLENGEIPRHLSKPRD